MMSKYILTILLAIITFSCTVKKGVDKESSPSKVIIDNSFKPTKSDIVISNVSLTNNIISLTVSGSNVCNENQFSLYTNEYFLKSMPPQKQLYLNKGLSENCATSNVINLKFDISTIDFKNYKKVVLNIGSQKLIVTNK